MGLNKQTGKEIAMKVVSVRQRVRARVESLKGQVSGVFLLSFLACNREWISPERFKNFVRQSADFLLAC